MRRQISRGAATALLALLTSTSLVACGGEESASSPGSSESSEPSGSSGSSGSSEETAPEPAAGEQVVELDDGSSFFAPKGWQAISASDLAEDDQALERMANEMNLTPEQALQALQASEVMVRSPKAVKGFTENLNVTRVPATIDQFDADQVSGQMESLGMKDVEVTEIETPAGPGFRVTGDLQMATMGTVVSDGVFVGAGEEIVNITATSPDRATAAELIERVIESFSTTS